MASLQQQIKTTKMQHSGYDPERFVGKDHEPFLCIICLNVVMDPFECHGCGKLFCNICITDWGKKNPDNRCPNRCSNNSITAIFSKALERLYKNLDIRCSNSKCKSILKLSDLVKHEARCNMVKCWNFDACERPVDETVKCVKPSCSETCSTVAALQEKFGNKKAMMDILAGFLKNARSVSPSKNNANNPPGLIPAPISVGDLAWDPSKTGGSIVITEGGVQCFLKEQSYLFRTSLTNNGFTSGRHYWEIIADSRTENELKIGVTTNKDFDYNSAFCDHPFGFAYYGLGQLRHNSNASGPSYGKKFKKEGVLGVLLNMQTGVLAFSLNGEYMGVAYKDPKLTQGPIFPAVALLHCAGCKIRSGLPVPSYFKD